MTNLRSYQRAAGLKFLERGETIPTAQPETPSQDAPEDDVASSKFSSTSEPGCEAEAGGSLTHEIIPEVVANAIGDPTDEPKPYSTLADIRKDYYNIIDFPDACTGGGRGSKACRLRSRRGGPSDNNADSESDAFDDDCDDQEFVWDSDCETGNDTKVSSSHSRTIRELKSKIKGRFEKSLVECVVNTDKIAPNYQEISMNPNIIKKLEQITLLSLQRPIAFSHGLLKGNKVTGAVLYGPPGTGKSLLAKAVAKQSGFMMISVSTAELWQKCHGDDEKMIKALFSVARKMHPCIIFLDEADAMLGARKGGEKRHIRSMFNQFLMEWDGLGNGLDAPFLLLATNRPYDLDPAVLRRAPVKIHLDTPTREERIGILKLLLKNEELGHDINIEALAKMAQHYTGSDLKNMCVTAATTCVMSQRIDTKERILRRDHFISALQTVRASTLDRVGANELRKFDGTVSEQQGQAWEEDED